MSYLLANIERPLIFSSCGHFVSDGGWTHSKRVIDNYEIIIGLTGTLYIRQDSENYEISPGDVLTLYPGKVHSGYRPTTEPCSFFWLHFTCKEQNTIISNEDAHKNISIMKSSPLFNKMSENMLIPDKFRPDNKERILIQFRQLLDINSNQYYTTHIADYLLTSLMIELTQQAIGKIPATAGNIHESSWKISIILEWIRINLHKDITVDKIADKFGYSSDHLSRLFKKHVGASAIKYINGMRILKAKELLCLSEKNIKEISYLIGFKDEKYFMKLFRHTENMTPTDYRKAYHKIHMNNM